MKTLFGSPQPQISNKKLELLHSSPNIYLVKNFLTPKEIEYFDLLVTLHQNKFATDVCMIGWY